MRGVAVESCVIPPPYTDPVDGKLRVDGAECTDAAGNDQGPVRPFILMPRWVCLDGDDFLKVLGACHK